MYCSINDKCTVITTNVLQCYGTPIEGFIEGLDKVMTRGGAAIFLGLVAAGDAFVATSAPSISSRRPVCLRGWCSQPPFLASGTVRAPALL